MAIRIWLIEYGDSNMAGVVFKYGDSNMAIQSRWRYSNGAIYFSPYFSVAPFQKCGAIPEFDFR